MLTSGVWQMRQSEGNNVAKRLSATLLTDETNSEIGERLRLKTLFPPVRIGYSLLLKTSLPCSPGTAKDATGKPVPV